MKYRVSNNPYVLHNESRSSHLNVRAHPRVCQLLLLTNVSASSYSLVGYEVFRGNEFAAINRLHIAFARRLRKAALFTVAGRPAARGGGRARRGWQNEPSSGPMHRCIWMSCRRSSLVWSWAAMGKQGLAYPLQFHRRSGAMYAESSHFLRTVGPETTTHC